QAEDGIRDFHVTGVQTCALPISSLRVAALLIFLARWSSLALERSSKSTGSPTTSRRRHSRRGWARPPVPKEARMKVWRGLTLARSEERRVGKEERRRW